MENTDVVAAINALAEAQDNALEAAESRHKTEIKVLIEKLAEQDNRISRKAWTIILAILITASALGANSIRMHYSWSADVNEAHKAFRETTEHERKLAIKYHKNGREREAALRDKIEELNLQIEHLEKAINKNSIGN